MNKGINDTMKTPDEQAFELLFRKYYMRLCGFANKFLYDPIESEEIVQEVFLNVWRKREQLNLNAGISAYLFRSVQNLSLNFIEHRKIVNSYYAVIAKAYENSSDDLSAESKLHYTELNQRVEEAIASLPAECRRIFQLSRAEGLKYAEIAAQLGISVKTVETQMSRALSKLKTELKDFLTILLISLLMYS